MILLRFLIKKSCEINGFTCKSDYPWHPSTIHFKFTSPQSGPMQDGHSVSMMWAAIWAYLSHYKCLSTHISRFLPNKSIPPERGREIRLRAKTNHNFSSFLPANEITMMANQLHPGYIETDQRYFSPDGTICASYTKLLKLLADWNGVCRADNSGKHKKHYTFGSL